MKVIAYMRVSTDKQAESGLSLDDQRVKLDGFAASKGYEISDYIIDDGYTGKDMNRPGLKKALFLLETGQADGLVVAKLDRLTRRLRDLIALTEGYFNKAYKLFSVNESIDTATPVGRMIMHILVSVLQWEVEECSNRTKAALAQHRAKGGFIGPVPFGYTPEIKPTGMVTLIPNISHRLAISRAKALSEAGANLREIGELLQSEGYRPAQGGNWHPNSVRRLLKFEDSAVKTG